MDDLLSCVIWESGLLSPQLDGFIYIYPRGSLGNVLSQYSELE